MLLTPYDFPLLLSVPRVGVVLVILDDFLFNITTIPKLHIVSILLFWTDSQKGVKFLELPGDPYHFAVRKTIGNAVAAADPKIHLRLDALDIPGTPPFLQMDGLGPGFEKAFGSSANRPADNQMHGLRSGARSRMRAYQGLSGVGA